MAGVCVMVDNELIERLTKKFQNYPRIKIEGVDGIFTLMNNDGPETGPVTVLEDFLAFRPGYAHMYNGVILRYGQKVCDRDGWSFVVEQEANDGVS
jgi:hypothetical protein